MTELLIISSRYVFVIFALLFVWESFLYIMYERGLRHGNLKGPIHRQRGIIIAFYLLGFLLLTLRNNEVDAIKAVNTAKLAEIGLVSLIFMFISTSIIFKNACPLLWNGIFFLFVMGLILQERLNPDRAARLLFFSIAGFVVSLFIPMVLYLLKDFSRFKWLYLLIAMSLLGALFIVGSEIYGARNWIKIGNMSFQPSEFAKFFYCLYLAASLKDAHGLKDIIFPSIMSAGIILMLVLQKDLGGALLFFIVFLLVFYSATGRISLTTVAILLFIAAGFLSYKLFPHVTKRFDSWLHPWKDPHGASYQVVQSVFALSSFGLWGIGLTRGIPLDIPFVSTDFAFAAIGEEMGAVFALFIIGLFILIFYRGVHIALRNADFLGHEFYSLLSVAIVGILSVQSFVILGGVIGLIPITGVTLPFISYGGSSAFISFILIGLLQWLHRQQEVAHLEESKNAEKHT